MSKIIPFPTREPDKKEPQLPVIVEPPKREPQLPLIPLIAE
jgi:hypothetical protein